MGKEVKKMRIAKYKGYILHHLPKATFIWKERTPTRLPDKERKIIESHLAEGGELITILKGWVDSGLAEKFFEI